MGISRPGSIDRVLEPRTPGNSLRSTPIPLDLDQVVIHTCGSGGIETAACNRQRDTVIQVVPSVLKFGNVSQQRFERELSAQICCCVEVRDEFPYIRPRGLE